MVYMQEIGVKRTPQIIINVLCFICLGASLMVLYSNDGSVIYHEGFFCDDKSIAYPYKPSTIPSIHLLIGATALSFLAIIMCEFIAFFELWRQRRVDVTDEEKKTPDGDKHDEDAYYPEPWKVLMTRIGMQMILLIYGFMLISFVTEFIKVTMGRLRPNFLSVCQLVPGSYNCSVGFVTSYECAQKNWRDVVNARKSFVSGHASISFFHMIFIIFYIQPRLPIRYWSIMKPLVQTLCFLQATYVSITRITDYKHHYSDVCCGALLGIVAGYLMAVKVTHVVPFRRRPFPRSMFHRYITDFWRPEDSDRHSHSHSHDNHHHHHHHPHRHHNKINESISHHHGHHQHQHQHQQNNKNLNDNDKKKPINYIKV